MVKYFLFLLPGFTLLDFFFQPTVSVTDNLPEAMGAGTSAIVEYRIEKGDNTGFAKLQLEIPFGFTVKPIETKGASFTFSAQTAKFIWMTLPSDPSFKVKYELIASPEMTGNHTITGQFSYIKDNERVDFDLSDKTIAIGGEAMASNGKDESVGVSSTALPEMIPSGIINENCFRDMTPIGGGKYLVKVTVKDLGVKGYAKLEERVNGKAKLVNKKSLGAVVTTEGGMIKYVWFDAPAAAEFSVEYEVSDIELPFYLSGKFSFVRNNLPTEIEVGITPGYNDAIATINAAAPIADVTKPAQPGSDSLTASAEKVNEIKKDSVKEVTAVATSPIADVKKETPKTEPVAEVKKDTAKTAPSVEIKKETPMAEAKPQDKEVVAASEADPKTQITKAPAPEKGITYKVQILAAHRTVGKAYFAQRHNFNGDFSIENHEGWVKYTTGQHSVYVDARNARESIRGQYNFPGPFVTAYNDGQRITVQEALMISNQQWVK